jgi:uncharacterized protein (DUF3820 family)
MGLTDYSAMPWGKYKGKTMVHVPDDYLLWLWDNDKCFGEVKDYIEDNLEAIRYNVSLKQLRIKN